MLDTFGSPVSLPRPHGRGREAGRAGGAVGHGAAVQSRSGRGAGRLEGYRGCRTPRRVATKRARVGSHAMRRAGSPRSPTGRIARPPVPTRSIPRPRRTSASCVGSIRGADRDGSVTSSRSSAWPSSPSGRPPAACARPKYAYIVAPARARPDVFGKREGRRTGVEVAGALVSGSGFAGPRAVHGEP